MYWPSADFSGWFRLRGKSRKTYDIIVSEKKSTFFLNFFLEGATNSQPPFLWLRQRLVKNCMLYNKVAKLYSGSMLQLYFGEQTFWKNHLTATHRIICKEELTTPLSDRGNSVNKYQPLVYLAYDMCFQWQIIQKTIEWNIF